MINDKMSYISRYQWYHKYINVINSIIYNHKIFKYSKNHENRVLKKS